MGGRAGSVPVLRTTPRAASKATGPSSVSTPTRPGPSSRPWPRTIAHAGLLQRLGVVVVGPVVVGLAGSGRRPATSRAGRRPRRPGRDAPGLGQQVGAGGPSASRACSPRTGTRRPPGPAPPDHLAAPPRRACGRRTHRRARARAPRRHSCPPIARTHGGHLGIPPMMSP